MVEPISKPADLIAKEKLHTLFLEKRKQIKALSKEDFLAAKEKVILLQEALDFFMDNYLRKSAMINYHFGNLTNDASLEAEIACNVSGDPLPGFEKFFVPYEIITGSPEEMSKFCNEIETKILDKFTKSLEKAKAKAIDMKLKALTAEAAVIQSEIDKLSGKSND